MEKIDEVPTYTDAQLDQMARHWVESKEAGPVPKLFRDRVSKFSKAGKKKQAIIERKEKQLIAKEEKRERAQIIKEIEKREKNEEDSATKQKFLINFIESNGNITKAAQNTWDITDRMVASRKGTQYLKINQAALQLFLEEKGYTMGWLLQLLAKKTEESRNPDFLDRMWRLLGYGELNPKQVQGPQIVNVIQAQKKDAIDFGFEEGEIINAEDNTT